MIADGRMRRPSSTDPIKGLIVKRPFIDLILSGKKRYEFRRFPTRYRGKVALIHRGKAYGTVFLKGVEELEVNRALPRMSEEERRFLEKYAAGRETIYAWRLEDPVAFREPVPVEVKRGAQVWVRLKEEDVKKIMDAEAEGKGKESRRSQV